MLIKISNFDSHLESSLPSSLSHYYIVVPAGNKLIAILFILIHLKVGKSLCFTLSSQTAIRLAQFVKSAGLNCSFITNETDANIVDIILDSFSKQESEELLIASDGLSRGLDLPGVDAVINYDCPTSSQLYLHRAGRCARAGRAGACYTIVAPSEARFYKENVCSRSKRIRPDAESLQELSNIARDALDRK
jgi:superfamily II DNA/RNA helicase